MAGKSYTMREMRAIVEYLTERKAFGEIKGRKMWMEFANSQHTTRTWQSLKETFLKRILPDLHNPYYKLSQEQVRSFRAGYDVAEKEKSNRLEFRTASEDSSTNADSQNENEQSTAKKDKIPPTSNHGDEPSTTDIKIEPPTTSVENEVDKSTGEGITSAKIQSRNRSSVDTVVLEYETAEDIQRALESPKGDEGEGKTKSLKDLLTFEYTAPLTPIVRELLDDFETESEVSDKENQLKILENPAVVTENTKSVPVAVEETSSVNTNTNHDAESPILIQDSDDLDTNEVNAKGLEIAAEETTHANVQDKSDDAQKSRSLTLKKSQKNIQEDNVDDETNKNEHNKEPSLQNNDITNSETTNDKKQTPKNAEPNVTTEVTTEFNAPDTAKNDIQSKNNNTINNTGNSIQNTGNTSFDTIIPNNQEALDGSKKVTQKINLDKTVDDVEIVENNTKMLEKISTQDSRENKKPKLSEKDDNADEIEIHGRITPVIEINTDTPNIDPDTIIEKNAEILDTTIIEINTDTPATNDTEIQFNAFQKKVMDNTDKPSTSTAKDVSIPINEDKDVEIIEDKNPCLLSVSLFDEQFKKTQYSDSDCDDETTPLPKQNLNKDKPQIEKNEIKETREIPQKETIKKIAPGSVVVKENPKIQGILQSSADCEPQRQATVNKTRQVDTKSVNLQRERALANVFGFAHGASSSRKRRVSNRRRSHHHQHHRRHSKNDDSNSSEWTSESDSESYVSPPRGRRYRQTRKYLKPKSSRILQDPDEGMLYVIFGKKIYPLVKDGKHVKNFLTYRPDSGSDDMEEESYWKQKYVDEKKRVEEVKKLLKESLGNMPQTYEPSSSIVPSTSRRATTTHRPQKPVENGSSKEIAVAPTVENKEVKDDKMILKIASKNGVEYCLEGGWTQITNAMPQMVKMLQSETNVSNNGKLKASSSRTAVVQPPCKEELMDISSGASTPVIATLVVDPEVQEKVNQIETEIFKEIEEHEKEERVIESEKENANVTKRRGKARKESSSSNSTTKSPTKRTIASKNSTTEPKEETPKPAKNKRASKQQLEVPIEIESKQSQKEKPTRGKISEKQTRAAALKESNVATDQKVPNRRESLRLSKQKDPTELKEITANGTVRESTIPPVATRSSTRLSVTPKKYDTDSSASDVRSVRLRNSTSKESTLLTGFDSQEVRFMFPPTPKTKATALPKERKIEELSVVENLSISREMIKTDDHPKINEFQKSMRSSGSSRIMDFDYVISNVDVSAPLMDQHCNVQKSKHKKTPQNNTQINTWSSDPLLNKVCKVNIENLTLSESLDHRLRDLLIESSKKKTREANDTTNAMEVDETRIVTVKTRAANKKQTAMEVDETKSPTAKKTRAKKRSSTPQKKKVVKKSKAPKDAVIEEEHMESCAYEGRKSCPPVMTFIPNENANRNQDVTLNTKKVKSKKKKKDVIKVKIQRPKKKTRSSEKVQGKSAGTGSTVSTCTDSGINETDTISGVFLKGSDVSVDLIHNHSETCLRANECIGDSVEFINDSKSIISVNSSIQSVDTELQRLLEDAATISGEFFSKGNSVTTEPRTAEDNFESPDTIFHTPATVNSSIITDDLSDNLPSQPTKWYLFSDDDTNTMPASSGAGYGANLKQIFPVTCAVPDLSTISEMSKENGDSRRANFDTDGDSRNLNSQSIF